MTEHEQTSEMVPGETAPAESPATGDQSSPSPTSATEQGPAAESSSPDPDQEPDESKPDKGQKAQKSQIRYRRPKRSAASVVDQFIACPRCSFFLVGYRLIQADFDEAAENATDDWLDLSWNLAVRNLVTKSYGADLAGAFQVMQGVCPDCRRTFIVETPDDEDKDPRLSIQINPRY